MNDVPQSRLKYADQGLLFLRLCLGVVFIFHGYPKLLSGPEIWAMVGAAMQIVGISSHLEIWGLLAATIELAGGVCLLLGILFRPFCALLTLTMLVAFSTHMMRGDPFQISSHSLTAAIVFAALFLTGPGKFTVTNGPAEDDRS